MKKLILGIALFAFVGANAQTASVSADAKKETKEVKSCEKGKACCKKKSATACAEKKEESKATSSTTKTAETKEKKSGANE